MDGSDKLFYIKVTNIQTVTKIDVKNILNNTYDVLLFYVAWA